MCRQKWNGMLTPGVDIRQLFCLKCSLKNEKKIKIKVSHHFLVESAGRLCTCYFWDFHVGVSEFRCLPLFSMWPYHDSPDAQDWTGGPVKWRQSAGSIYLVEITQLRHKDEPKSLIPSHSFSGVVCLWDFGHFCVKVIKTKKKKKESTLLLMNKCLVVKSTKEKSSGMQI